MKKEKDNDVTPNRLKEVIGIMSGDEFKELDELVTSQQQPSTPVENLKKIRDYFGTHDKTPFEHWAYTYLNNLINAQ